MRIGIQVDAGYGFNDDRYDNILPRTMRRTRLRLWHNTFEAVHREVWNDPTTGGFTRPQFICTLRFYFIYLLSFTNPQR
jgi:hypothetical protein